MPKKKYKRRNKNISNRDFLSSPALVKKYGLLKDTDKDNFINAADCYPFDSSRHGFFGDIYKKVKTKAVTTYKKADVKLGGRLPMGVTPKEAKAKLKPVVKPPKYIIPPPPSPAYTAGASPPDPRGTLTAPPATEHLQKASRVVTEVIRPESKKARIALETADKKQVTAIEKYNKDVTKLDQDISSFSKQYGGKELPQSTYDTATKTQQRLQQRQSSLEQTAIVLSGYEEKRAQLAQAQEVKRKRVPVIKRAAQSLVVGFVTAPIGAAALVSGVVTQPHKTITGAITGVKAIPREIKSKPVETVGELAGGAAFFYGAGAVVGSISKAGGMKVTPKITQSASFSDATMVGKSPKGINLWDVKGKVVTKLKHPKTGKTLEVFETESFTKTITAPTKDGAFKAASKTWAATAKKEAAVVLGKEPKVVTKASVTKAKGTMTISPTDIKKVSKGYGTTEIQEVGKLKITATPKKTVVDYKSKLGKQSEALTNIMIEQVGVRPKKIVSVSTKKKVVDIITGEEYVYRYKAKSDIYGKKGGAQILKADELGFAKSFVPKKAARIYFDVKGKPITFKAKVPKYKPATTDILGKGFPKAGRPKLVRPKAIQAPKLMTEKAAAKMSAETTAKVIGKMRAPKKVKVVSKVVPVSRVVQLLSPAVGMVTRQKLISKPKAMFEMKTKSVQRMSQLLGPVVRTRYYPPSTLSQTISQASTLSQTISQASTQKITTIFQPSKPGYSRPISPSLIIPTIIRPHIVKKETELEKRRRRKAEAKLRAQRRAYQASVGAVVLGITAPKVTSKKFTGFGLRPMIARRKPKRKSNKSNYLKRIERTFR